MPLVTALMSATVALAAVPSHDIVPADQFALDGVEDLVVDDNGTRIVFVRSRWQADLDRKKQDLWVADTRNDAFRRLTFTTSDAHAPTVSPDDTWVYFLASADSTADGGSGGQQVWRVPLAGGPVQPVTTVQGGVAAYQLAPDGDSLWFLTHDEQHVDDSWDALRDRWSDLHYADRVHTVSTLHQLDLDSWRVTPRWEPGRYILEFEVDANGEHVAAITAPDAALISHEGGTEVELLHLTTGRVREVPDASWRAQGPSPHGWLHGLSWASDGRALSFRIDHDGYAGETFVAELVGDTVEVSTVPRPGNLTAVGSSVHWVPGTRELCYRAADRTAVRIVCVPRIRDGKGGKVRMFPKGDVVVDDYAFSGDGRDIVAVVGTPTHFPELYRLPARGNLYPRQVGDLNPQTEGWKLPTVDTVTWKAPDGTTVEGVLETPHGWTPASGPLPLVVQLHGGPTAHSRSNLALHVGGRGVFASQGWALLSPNYRGSVGYGDAFLEGLIGHENDIEVADILSGVDAMVERGIADPQRLAVMGWSNGGFLTGAVLTHTDRFKAASLGAGVVDQLVQWGLEDTPGHVINFMQGQPWDKADAYRAASPLFQAHEIRTPVLFHHGEDDERVPLAHARMLFRALDTYLDVPAELVIYPDTGHGTGSMKFREAKVAWDLAWFERYVLEADAPAEPMSALPAAEDAKPAAPAPAQKADPTDTPEP